MEYDYGDVSPAPCSEINVPMGGPYRKQSRKPGRKAQQIGTYDRSIRIY
jgi:hypothetical protein